jgi:hypothetical protein
MATADPNERNQLTHTDACLEYAARLGQALCVRPGLTEGGRRHTETCVRYAAKTRKAFCIAECADLRRSVEERGRGHENGSSASEYGGDLSPEEQAAYEAGRVDPGDTYRRVTGSDRGGFVYASRINEIHEVDEGERQAMAEITVPLSDEASQLLNEIAETHFRSPELQASYMLEQILALRLLTRDDIARLRVKNGAPISESRNAGEDRSDAVADNDHTYEEARRRRERATEETFNKEFGDDLGGAFDALGRGFDAFFDGLGTAFDKVRQEAERRSDEKEGRRRGDRRDDRRGRER